MKKLAFVVVLIGLGLVGVAFWVNQKASATPMLPKRASIDRGDIVEQVSATGKLIYKDILVISSDVPLARVVDVLPEAEPGKHVAKNQPLLKLDDTIVKAKSQEAQSGLQAAEALVPQAEAKLDEAKSAIAAAEALEQQANAKKSTAEAQVRLAQNGVDLAKKERDRVYKLRADVTQDKLEAVDKAVTYAQEGVTVAESQIKEADAAILAAKANVKKAKAGEAEANAAILAAKANVSKATSAVTAAQQALDQMTIKAPVAGVILQKNIVKGQLIAPQATPILFTLAPDLEKMELRAQVGETDYAKIKVGMKVTFTVDAYTDKDAVFEGTVVQMSEVPATAPSGREGLPAVVGPVFYPVTIDVVPQTGKRTVRPLKAGYTANVELIVRKVENVLRVPTAALNFQPENLDAAESKHIAERATSGWKPLWTWTTDEKMALVFVRTGASDGTYTEIAEVADSGKLTEGTQVVVEAAPAEKTGGLFGGEPPKIRL